jgi:uncharacterized repeat protein (TIGR03803 family)
MTGVVAVFAAALLASAASAGTLEILNSFADEDGEYPSTDLVFDAEGNLYGSAVIGGEFGGGTVFKLSPAESGWTTTVLHHFTGGADGGQPYNGVTLDAQGNVYGTAVVGGTGGFCPEDGCGVAYKLTKSGDTYTHSVIYNFQGGEDGQGPGAAMSFDRNGNLYGMTAIGGLYGLGIIYQLTPDASNPNGLWTERIVHHFTGGKDGSSGSAGRLLLDADGNFFGVATTGGLHGKGTFFKLTAATDGSWKFKTLYAFRGMPDAGFPYGGLVADAKGNLFGTTYYDGENNLGSVYQLSRTPAGVWKEQVLYSFKGGVDGVSPISHLVIDAKGTLWGTTSEGGAAGCGCGTIFTLNRTSSGVWKENVVYSFEGSPDGAYAYNGLVADSAGNLYGATVHGGEDDDGTAFKYTP